MKVGILTVWNITASPIFSARSWITTELTAFRDFWCNLSRGQGLKAKGWQSITWGAFFVFTAIITMGRHLNIACGFDGS